MKQLFLRFECLHLENILSDRFPWLDSDIFTHQKFWISGRKLNFFPNHSSSQSAGLWSGKDWLGLFKFFLLKFKRGKPTISLIHKTSLREDPVLYFTVNERRNTRTLVFVSVLFSFVGSSWRDLEQNHTARLSESVTTEATSGCDFTQELFWNRGHKVMGYKTLSIWPFLEKCFQLGDSCFHSAFPCYCWKHGSRSRSFECCHYNRHVTMHHDTMYRDATILRARVIHIKRSSILLIMQMHCLNTRGANLCNPKSSNVYRACWSRLP